MTMTITRRCDFTSPFFVYTRISCLFISVSPRFLHISAIKHHKPTYKTLQAIFTSIYTNYSLDYISKIRFMNKEIKIPFHNIIDINSQLEIARRNRSESKRDHNHSETRYWTDVIASLLIARRLRYCGVVVTEIEVIYD